jgi:phospho-N-acetylmuramoyl-pentapeptide-transferase
VRLFTSGLFLAGTATALGALVTFILLPRLWHLLPTDRGRAHAVDASVSLGKPIGAGAIFVPVFAAVALLVVPLEWPYLIVIACTLLAGTIGYLDDRRAGGWGEYALGAWDLVVSAAAALAISRMSTGSLWFPLVKTPVVVDPWLFIAGGTVLIWITINSTNATDGVDGLSGSLAALALAFLGAILYGIVGHGRVSAYRSCRTIPRRRRGRCWRLR